MARSVLLVDSDLDALGELASVLRARGLSVSLADDAERALERARDAKPDAVLVAEEMALDASVQQLFSADRELALVPCFLLVSTPSTSPTKERPFSELPRGDADLIAQRVMALPKAAARGVRAESGDFRGDLQQVSVSDLLQLLGMNRRTGALTLSTSAGVGEVRLEDGEVVDAVFRRLEGEKALYRLLAQPEGSFSFAGGYASALRRVQTSTHSLLMEGTRRADEVAALKLRLPVGDALLMTTPPPGVAPDLERQVAEILASPRTVDELLDELPQGDLEILVAVDSMLKAGVMRRIPRGAVRAELTEPEQMSVLAATVARLARPGFLGNARLIFAGPPERLNALGHAARRIADALPPTESTPTAPVPHVIASIRLGESVDLDIIALAELEAYAALWPLCLSGAAAVVRLDDRECLVLQAACAVAEVPLLEAVALLGEVDEADPVQAAALIRMTIEQVAGQGP